MRIRFEVSPGQVNNLPQPLREAAMDAVRTGLRREEARLHREAVRLEMQQDFVKQQQRELGEWEELLG